MNRMVATLLLLLSLGGCGFQKHADEQFGDQFFKTAISLIELHRIRFGSYPDSLADLKFIGQWDQAVLSSVEYKKVENGYELNLTRGWMGKPSLNYPREFWQGLGIVRTNIGMPNKALQPTEPSDGASPER